MVSYALNNSRVLIVPGYTDKELLLKADKKTKNQVTEPTSFLFEVRNIEVLPHRPSYEEFRSSDGLFMVEKNCDEFTHISMEILVHQNLANTKGKLTIDKNTKEVRLRVTDNSLPNSNTDKKDELQLGRFVRPEEFTDEYIKVRSNFFKDLLGRPLTLVSPLFESVPVAYIVDYSYNIPEGEEEASYSVVFQEVATTGF